MRVLTLRHKGYSLKLVFRADTYYTRTVFEPGKTEFEPGKTMYQLLFEHLVDGKTVSCGEIARHYKKVNQDINPSSIQQMLGRIEAAAKKSPTGRLREKHFKRPPRGGASPVVSRKSIDSRFTHAQREVIDETIKDLYKLGKLPRYADIRVICLVALRKKGLGGNVVLNDLAILRAKKRLGLPIRKRQPARPPRRRR